MLELTGGGTQNTQVFLIPQSALGGRGALKTRFQLPQNNYIDITVY